MGRAATAAKSVEPRITLSMVEVIRNELVRIRKKHGKLTAEIVVREAESKASPIHRFFTWDNAEAAHKQRLAEAMQLIHRVHVTVQVAGEDRRMRELVSVTRDDAREYMPIDEVSVDPRLREQVIDRARMEIDGWTKRYETYEHYFQSAFAAVKAARKKFPKVRRR